MYTLEITIDGLPKTINMTYGQHWSVKHKESKKWMRLVGAHIRWNYPKEPLKRANLTLIRGSSVPPDFDGLIISFKHVIDALVKLNVIIDDNMEIIGQPTYRWEKAKPGKGYVRITVQEICEIESFGNEATPQSIQT